MSTHLIAAEITRIPERALLTALIVAGILLVYWLMRRGWKNMVARQAGIAAPAAPTGAPAIAGPWSGMFIGTAAAGQWLDRIAVHTLGDRSTVTLSRTEHGIEVQRPQSRSFSIPNADVLAVRADSGIAGRAYETGGIIVVTFRLGDRDVESGFRLPGTNDHLAALAALTAITEVSS